MVPFRHFFISTIIYFFIQCFLSGSLHAQTNYTWTGNKSSDWANKLNWNPSSGVPGTSDNITIVSSGFSPVLDASRFVANFTINSGNPDLNTFTLNITGTSTFNSGTISNGTVACTGSNNYFNGSVFNTIINATGSSIQLNGSTFNGITTIVKNGSVSNNSSGGNVFNGITNISAIGAGTFSMSNVKRDIFNADVTFSTNSTIIYIAMNDSLGTQFNGNIYFNSTGTAGGIRLCQGSGKVVLANTKTINIGSDGFSSGLLYLKKVTQLGTAAQIMTTFSGISGIYLQAGNTFNGPVTFKAPNVTMDGSTFNGVANIEKTGAGNSWCVGSNTFNSSANITNSGSGELDLSGPDIFNGDVTFTSSGTNKIHIAYSSGTTTLFNGNVLFNSIGLSGGMVFSYGNGNSILASGKTINIGSLGFSSGTLYIHNFTQLGSTPQAMTTFSGTSILQLETGNTFNGPVTFTAPQLWCRATTFNANATFEKTGATSNYWYGDNIFNGTTIITNSGSGTLDLAQNTGDNFNGNVTFMQKGTARISPIVNGVSTFSGDISTVGSNSQVSFGYSWSSGRMVITGSNSQNFNGDATYPPYVKDLTMATTAKGTLNLNVNLTILTDIAFTSGIINSVSSNPTGNGLLIISNGVTISDLPDSSSYVNGYVKKIGNTAFTFPVGNAGLYSPISISAPSPTTDNFTAKFVQANTNSIYNISSKDASLYNVSSSEYWILNRTGGTSNVAVTLGWNTKNSGISLLADLRVAGWNGTTWKNLGNGGTTGTKTSGTATTTSAVATYGAFTLSSITPSNVLPIKLISFNAEKCNNEADALLKWSTATEENNDHFDIEEATDNDNSDLSFSKIGEVKGAGTSVVQLDYNFIDDATGKNGTRYYRLNQVDFDGTSTYSNIIALTFDQLKLQVSNLYPNPATEMLHLAITSSDSRELVVVVSNLVGEEIFKESSMVTTGTNTLNLDVSKLNKGLFFLNIIDGTDKYTPQKFVKF